MTREIIATPGALQEIRQAAKDIEEGRQDPWRVSKPLRDELEGFRGARRGEYRVVLSVDEERRVGYVVRIDHRSDAYR